MTTNRHRGRFTLNRRTFAGGSAAAVAAAPWLRASAQDASPAPVGGQGEDQLEIFSWWTAGSEAAGLEELFAAFSAVAPDVEIINAAVAGCRLWRWAPCW